jgi:acyl-CoA synthetase (AMP-forming)/AMP-acid ligase II
MGTAIAPAPQAPNSAMMACGELGALLFKGTAIGYGQLDRLVTAASAAFAAIGVSKGDRVALHSWRRRPEPTRPALPGPR